MGFFDKKSKTTTNQYTTTTNQSLQAQGPAVLGEGNQLSVVYSDQGAIANATQIARAAFDSYNDAMDDVNELAGDSLELSGYSINRALETVEETNAHAFDFADGAVDALADGAQRAGDTVATFADRAIQQVASATRSDTADVLNNLTKWVAGAIAVAAVAAIFMRSKN